MKRELILRKMMAAALASAMLLTTPAMGVMTTQSAVVFAKEKHEDSEKKQVLHCIVDWSGVDSKVKEAFKKNTTITAELLGKNFEATANGGYFDIYVDPETRHSVVSENTEVRLSCVDLGQVVTYWVTIEICWNEGEEKGHEGKYVFKTPVTNSDYRGGLGRDCNQSIGMCPPPPVMVPLGLRRRHCRTVFQVPS